MSRTLTPQPNPGVRCEQWLALIVCATLAVGCGSKREQQTAASDAAGGYEQFYLVADCNYNKADLGFDDNFTALIASLRVGWMGKFGDLPLQIWFGVGNWDTAATAKGHGTLPGGAELVFEADQKPHTNWMYDVGANLEISKQFQLVVDVGADFDGGYLVVIGPTYRFPNFAAS